jgi:hypothetical protein
MNRFVFGMILALTKTVNAKLINNLAITYECFFSTTNRLPIS